MDFVHTLSLLGGVAFFLFGMSVMGTALKRVAGSKLESYLWRLSSTPLKGFLLGTMVAAVIQSSSATSVMVVSFVNAGMMKLAQAISIILGANVGTTMTGWILTLSASSGTGVLSQLFSTAVLISILALIGVLLSMIAKKSTFKHIGQVFLGLATLLLAMTLISDAVSPLKGNSDFGQLLLLFKNPVFGVLAGTLVAAVVQSSSAGVGILQALCVTGALPYSVCLPLILGINLGASTPVLFSMVGGNKNAKRAAFSYFISNLAGIFIVYLLYLPLQLVFDFSFMSQNSSIVGIALMNSAIRIIVVLVLLPFCKLLEKVALFVIPSHAQETADEDEINSLSDRLFNYAPAALEKATAVTRKMAIISQKNLHRSIQLLSEFNRTDFNTVQEKESLVDKYEDKLGNFIINIIKNELDPNEQATVSELLSAIGDFERISDHAANLSEVAEEKFEKKQSFSGKAQEEIALLVRATLEITDLAVASFIEHDTQKARQIEPFEEVIDEMCKLLRANHIERLQSSDCTINTGFVFNDLLTNLERVADHCANIAFCVLHRFTEKAEGHEYNARVTSSDDFLKKFDEYRAIYLAPLE